MRETDSHQATLAELDAAQEWYQMGRYSTSMILTGIGGLIAVMALTVLIAPIAYDTDHFGDTPFILGAAWRQFYGLEPAVDFGHFYGGFASWTIARAIAFFGPDVHAYDYALLMIFAAFALSGALIAWNRVSAVGMAIAFLVIATLIFTRHPLESAESLTRLVSTHSFLYNRIGLATVVMAGLFAALPSRSSFAEALAGLTVGGLLLAAALAKPTFIILAPGVLLALAVQARWIAALSVFCGVVLTSAVFDPWGARWLASYQYAMASTGDRADANLVQLIRKAIQVPLAQPIALAIATAAIVSLLLWPPRPWRSIAATFLVAGAALGLTATMGGGGNLGQLALPILAMICIAAAELARGYAGRSVRVLQTAALILALGFSVPHVANLLGTTAEAWSRRDQILISSGPLKDYLSVVEAEYARPGRATQYQMLADGIDALHGIGDMSKHGIIADNGISFEFAMLAKPVSGFPLWPRAISAELAPQMPLPAEADFVLIGIGPQEDADLGPLLRSKLTNQFILCKSTDYWDIYVRNITTSVDCQRSPDESEETE